MNSSIAKCPVCNELLEGDSEDFERHVNLHLDEKEDELSKQVALQLSQDSTRRGPNEETPQPNVDEVEINIGQWERMMLEAERNDAALATALANSAQTNESDVYVSPSLRGSLSDSAERYYPNILKVVLPLFESIDRFLWKKLHICSKLDLYSSNIAGLGWDCGYRNIQMICSALLRRSETAGELKAAGMTEVPSIPEIAGRIESAWKDGFDPEGAKSFGGTLVDKDVWIGATEAFVLFRSLNLNAHLTDFETPTQRQRSDLFEWVFRYFDEQCDGRHCSLHRKGLLNGRRDQLVAPLFCQWQGHSVTIVGAEKTRRGELNLIILDPSRGFFTSLLANAWSGDYLLRRSIDHPQFSHPRFQLVSVLPRERTDTTPTKEGHKGVFNRFRLGGPS